MPLLAAYSSTFSRNTGHNEYTVGYGAHIISGCAIVDFPKYRWVLKEKKVSMLANTSDLCPPFAPFFGLAGMFVNVECIASHSFY